MSGDDRERDAFLMGERDFYDGIPIGDCPHPMSINEPDSSLCVRWSDGWRQAEARAARLMLELQMHPVCADNAAERPLVAWAVNAHHEADAEKGEYLERRTLH